MYSRSGHHHFGEGSVNSLDYLQDVPTHHTDLKVTVPLKDSCKPNRRVSALKPLDVSQLILLFDIVVYNSILIHFLDSLQ